MIRKLDLQKDMRILSFQEDKTRILLKDDVSTSLFGRQIFLGKFSNHMYVSITNGNYEGYVIFDFEEKDDKTFCLVYGIHLIKSAREKGIGTKLMECVMKECKKEDVTKIVLEVDKRNKAAQAFYRRQGFKEQKRERNRETQTLLMTLDLPMRA